MCGGISNDEDYPSHYYDDVEIDLEEELGCFNKEHKEYLENKED